MSGNLTLYIEEGKSVHAQNSGNQPVSFVFSWITEGRNKEGLLVSSTKKTSDNYTLGPGQEMQMFTAPVDPQKKITYTFRTVEIMHCSNGIEKNKNGEMINTRMNGGR